ncbi:MAG: HEAT repeat domain-containing protein [Candidatus Micrarchaeota archaeon]
MVEQKQEQKGPIHGGDDDTEYVDTPPTKPKLKKFASHPDKNIRDVFWDIMGLYATKKEVSPEEIRHHENSRMALVRIAVSTLSNPEKDSSGLTPNFTALYTLMMLLDEDWEDAFIEFVSESYEAKKRPMLPVIVALNKLAENSRYKEKLSSLLSSMIRDRYSTECTTAYLTELHNKEMVKEMKKELMIIARSDIEENQYNAINALTHIQDEEDVQALFINLLNHWDEETRRMVAMILSEKVDSKVLKAAKRQMGFETNQYITKILKKIVSKGEKDGNTKDP